MKTNRCQLHNQRPFLLSISPPLLPQRRPLFPQIHQNRYQWRLIGRQPSLTAVQNRAKSWPLMARLPCALISRWIKNQWRRCCWLRMWKAKRPLMAQSHGRKRTPLPSPPMQNWHAKHHTACDWANKPAAQMDCQWLNPLKRIFRRLVRWKWRKLFPMIARKM